MWQYLFTYADFLGNTKSMWYLRSNMSLLTYGHFWHNTARKSLFTYADFLGNTKSPIFFLHMPHLHRRCLIFFHREKITFIERNWTLLWVSFQMYNSDFRKICRTVVVGFYVMICFRVHIYRSRLTNLFAARRSLFKYAGHVWHICRTSVVGVLNTFRKERHRTLLQVSF